MTPLGLIVAALAVWEILEIWHHSTLLAGWRAHVEGREHGQLRTLLTCPFCLAPWTATLVLMVVIYGPEYLVAAMKRIDSEPGGPQTVIYLLLWAVVAMAVLVVYAFAVARLANLGNDLTHAWCRTPKVNVSVVEDLPPGSPPRGETEASPGPKADETGARPETFRSASPAEVATWCMLRGVDPEDMAVIVQTTEEIMTIPVVHKVTVQLRDPALLKTTFEKEAEEDVATNG